jgi:hypothetical protein
MPFGSEKFCRTFVEYAGDIPREFQMLALVFADRNGVGFVYQNIRAISTG